MRKTLGKYVLRTSAFALASLAWAGVDVTAATLSTATIGTAVQTYSTTGTVTAIDPTSGKSTITGTPDITYVPIQSGAYSAPSAAGLGSFQVSALAAGTETDYKNTPFQIIYSPLTTNGVTSTAPPIVISGVLNGYIRADSKGNQSSTVVATFKSIDSPVFSTPDGDFLSTVSLANTKLSLVAFSAGGGQTTVESTIVTTGALPGAAPEPTTMAILATSLVGLGLRQKLRSSRKSS